MKLASASMVRISKAKDRFVVTKTLEAELMVALNTCLNISRLGVFDLKMVQ
jgi:hypothetical protein